MPTPPPLLPPHLPHRLLHRPRTGGRRTCKAKPGKKVNPLKAPGSSLPALHEKPLLRRFFLARQHRLAHEPAAPIGVTSRATACHDKGMVSSWMQPRPANRPGTGVCFAPTQPDSHSGFTADSHSGFTQRIHTADSHTADPPCKRSQQTRSSAPWHAHLTPALGMPHPGHPFGHARGQRSELLRAVPGSMSLNSWQTLASRGSGRSHDLRQQDSTDSDARGW